VQASPVQMGGACPAGEALGTRGLLLLGEPAFATAASRRPRAVPPEGISSGRSSAEGWTSGRGWTSTAVFAALGAVGLARQGQARRHFKQQVVCLAVTDADKITLSDKKEKKAISKKGKQAIEGSQKKKKKLISPQRRLQRVFMEEFKAAMFTENPFYESDEASKEGRQRVYDYWLENRPLRTIDRIDDAQTSVGCTWEQADGRKGVSYAEFNEEGRISYMREVIQPPAFRFGSNSWKSMAPAYDFMGWISDMANGNSDYIYTEDPNLKPQTPMRCLMAPQSRRAPDVVRYLWEEAWLQKIEGVSAAVNSVMAEYSEDAVFEDLSGSDDTFAKGKEEVRRYMAETLEAAPGNLRWVLDDVTDGEKACVALWHCEFGVQTKPRGVTYYELNDEGKVSYARAAYNFTW